MVTQNLWSLFFILFLETNVIDSCVFLSVELILQEHLGLTMKLFAHYAGDAGSSSTMNRSEFNRFIKEGTVVVVVVVVVVVIVVVAVVV
jgi:hypothetical protein